MLTAKNPIKSAGFAEEPRHPPRSQFWPLRPPPSLSLWSKSWILQLFKDSCGVSSPLFLPRKLPLWQPPHFLILIPESRTIWFLRNSDAYQISHPFPWSWRAKKACYLLAHPRTRAYIPAESAAWRNIPLPTSLVCLFNTVLSSSKTARFLLFWECQVRRKNYSVQKIGFLSLFHPKDRFFCFGGFLLCFFGFSH